MTDEEKELKAIGQQLKEALVKKKITIYRITRETKLNYDVVNGILTGSKRYNIKSILSIMKIAGVEFKIKEKNDEHEKAS